MDELEELAAAAQGVERRNKSTPEVIQYKSYATLSQDKRMEAVTRYRNRVGHRSFIFQIWLLLWTVFYIVWIASLFLSAGSHSAPTPAFSGVNAPASPIGLSDVSGIVAALTSGWICAGAGWGIVGLPVGIAAVATMENNKK
jgi:hypothetical protein